MQLIAFVADAPTVRAILAPASAVQDSKTSYDVYYTDLKGDRKLVPLLNSSYAETDAKLSPDGQ